VPLLDRLALIFAVVEKGRYAPISSLILRALDDFQVAIFLTLCQIQGDVVELMRDVLEIELLLRDFKHDKVSIEEWIGSDAEKRKRLYSANALRQRHANRLGINPKDLPDAADYRLHSQALHISTIVDAPPFRLRGINQSDDPFAVDLGFREIFYHAESLFKTLVEFITSVTGQHEDFEKSLSNFRQASALSKLVQELYYGIIEAIKQGLGTESTRGEEVEVEIGTSNVLEKHENAFKDICSGRQLIASCIWIVDSKLTT
jgi:hypothetical protein